MSSLILPPPSSSVVSQVRCKKLLRALRDIVVATRGRILDHLQNSLSVGLEDLSILVLDEADHLLELGVTQQVHELATKQNSARVLQNQSSQLRTAQVHKFITSELTEGQFNHQKTETLILPHRTIVSPPTSFPRSAEVHSITFGE